MADNEWTTPAAPPPPLFFNQKERDFVKQVNDEITDRVIGQEIVYYPVSYEHTKFHPVYGEALEVSFQNPVRVKVLVRWEGTETETTGYGVDRSSTIVVGFFNRRLHRDYDLYAREGDYILYGDLHYEIVLLDEPRLLWGQVEYDKLEIAATCIQARSSLFDAK